MGLLVTFHGVLLNSVRNMKYLVCDLMKEITFFLLVITLTPKIRVQ